MSSKYSSDFPRSKTAQGQIRLLASSEFDLIALISALEATQPGIRFTAPKQGRGEDWLAYGTVVATAGEAK